MQQVESADTQRVGEAFDGEQGEVLLAPLDCSVPGAVHTDVLSEFFLAEVKRLAMRSEVRPEVSLQVAFHSEEACRCATYGSTDS